MKQDRQGVRTASHLEQKYNFGESFAQLLGISNDTRMYVDKVESELRNEFRNQVTQIARDTEQIIMTALEEYVKTGDFEEFQQTMDSELAGMEERISEKLTFAGEQILQIQKDLEEVEGSLEEQGGKWQSLKDDLAQVADSLTKSIGSVGDQISSVDGDVQKITEELEKHFAFITSGLHIKAESNGVGIGKEPVKPNTLEVGVNAEFEQALVRMGNVYSFQPEGVEGVQGYILLAVITLTKENVDAPIAFKINQRGGLHPMEVYVRFAGSGTTDPDLESVTYEGDDIGTFLVKSAVSTWKLYVDNTAGCSNPCLQEWYTTADQMSGISVAFQNEFVEGAAPSALGTYYRAVPAKMQSILNFIYPVGSIYLAYNHTSPDALFGGTWERIEDALLWAATAGDTVGQTGNTSVTADDSGLVYIQISAWRRTS